MFQARPSGAECEAGPLLQALRAAGFDVTLFSKDGGARISAFRDVSVVVIDLSRLPSHGRAVAAWLRGSKNTRHIPIVFVDGEPAKIVALRQEIPDAVYTPLQRAAVAVKRAVKSPANANPVVPKQIMASLRSTALMLGITADMSVLLGPLPKGVQLHEAEVEAKNAVCPITLWFVREPSEFAAQLSRRRALAARSKLWIVWRKGQPALNGNTVRQAALALGLVDYKICSLDAVWSGMLFALRKV